LGDRRHVQRGLDEKKEIDLDKTRNLKKGGRCRKSDFQTIGKRTEEKKNGRSYLVGGGSGKRMCGWRELSVQQPK